MTLEQQLTADIAVAMKSKDAARLSALRMLKAALMNKGVEKNRALEAGEELQVVSTLVKQRRDSIEQFTKGGRTDLAEKERAEIGVLETYLPPSVTIEEIDQAVAQAIADTGASGRSTRHNFLWNTCQTFGGAGPSIHFERPSQPLTILL